MNITIDGQLSEVIPSDKNLIDVADRMKIAIPCACYRSTRRYDCCRACVVVVDGKRRFACTTAPTDGMRVVVDRKDLKALRRRRLTVYRDRLKTGRSKDSCCPRSKPCCG
jgi:NADH dehydrogenase/NADH:ubiquinone oxidoreductase subunit G